jgi:hypothetical protein
MVDSARLGAVVDECTAWAAELVVESDRCGEAAEASEDTLAQPGEGRRGVGSGPAAPGRLRAHRPSGRSAPRLWECRPGRRSRAGETRRNTGNARRTSLVGSVAQGGAFDGFAAAGAFDRGGVDRQQIVMESRTLAGEHAHQPLQHIGQPPAALEIPRLLGQLGNRCERRLPATARPPGQTESP